MADNECKIVRMKSSDEQIFEVEEAVALKSQTIKDMVGEIGNESIVPLFNVSAKTLAKVIEYCRYHIDANDETETSTPAVKKWDEDFFKVSQDELYHLIMAANYLNIKDLLDLGCQTVANMIKGKSPEEIRRTFNIKNDFTEEELEEVRCENAWALE